MYGNLANVRPLAYLSMLVFADVAVSFTSLYTLGYNSEEHLCYAADLWT